MNENVTDILQTLRILKGKILSLEGTVERTAGVHLQLTCINGRLCKAKRVLKSRLVKYESLDYIIDIYANFCTQCGHALEDCECVLGYVPQIVSLPELKSVAMSRRVESFLQQVIHERNEHPQNIIPKEPWFKRLDNTLKQSVTSLGKDFQRLKNELVKCRDYIFNFLEDLQIPSDNNGSERGIRKLKNVETFQTELGADAFGELHPIVETAKKHDLSHTRLSVPFGRAQTVML